MPKFNDLDLKNWKDIDLDMNSLWNIPERKKGGKHSNFYHGNFVPQIPEHFIKRFTKKGGWVFDPFLGSATTAIEAEELGRNVVGVDIQESLVNRAKSLIKIKENSKYIGYNINNRRYIGNKHKLNDWIFSLILKECKGESFADIFGGTGSVSNYASKYFNNIIINDFLYSNYAIYQAFFSGDVWNKLKIINIINKYNSIDGDSLQSNYFSENFGGKYFSLKSSKIIGYIRNDIEENKDNLTKKEYYILIASLLYSIDKIANTVGHYDAYFKKDNIEDFFEMKLINPINIDNVEIYQDDANELVKNIKADIVYIDPPYNSRQYSRFYHVLENLTQWKKPKLYGVALKPDPEKMSDYCKVSAGKKFRELINDLDAKYLVTSYNNTYKSKSNSSKNKITLEEMESILNAKGKTKVFEKSYKHFNAGNTNFDDHREFLFITKVTNGEKNS